MLYVDHLKTRGAALYAAACERDLEGIVGKWTKGRYHTDGVSTSWVKIKNPMYSQAEGRRELFEHRGPARRTRTHGPLLMLQSA